MKIYRTVIGSFETNCYLLVEEKSGEAAAVDCALYNDAYRQMLQTAGVTALKYILLTHGHFDHISGVKALKDACGGEVCISERDSVCLTDAHESLNAYISYAAHTPCAPDRLLREGQTLSLGDRTIRVMETPGHTRGSVCFLTDDAVFSGDTLFRLSMGRTDMPGGSTRQLFGSLQRLGEMQGDYTVYPGHGEASTLDFEQKYNRYLRSEKYVHNYPEPYV